ncbi:hypothetical protein [Paenibacillus thalictri]|uniref:Uncharacterized protein n=1 Tax=Paenibacillus thalictri TaxID=2527873 RepID=A0A4Q9DCY5_9BACL|nr:hypothetical protein [Paenibacillus thalictri]TBL68564.1 hypothetical protein EYB31_37840 [Paenibacillus thalictri]
MGLMYNIYRMLQDRSESSEATAVWHEEVKGEEPSSLIELLNKPVSKKLPPDPSAESTYRYTSG